VRRRRPGHGDGRGATGVAVAGLAPGDTVFPGGTPGPRRSPGAPRTPAFPGEGPDPGVAWGDTPDPEVPRAGQTPVLPGRAAAATGNFSVSRSSRADKRDIAGRLRSGSCQRLTGEAGSTQSGYLLGGANVANALPRYPQKSPRAHTVRNGARVVRVVLPPRIRSRPSPRRAR
jgi:hypothetical protein